MPSNKKPRRKYQPKGSSRAIAFEVLHRAHVLARVQENFYRPLDAQDQRDVAIAFGASIDALSKGNGSDEHVQTLATMCNASLVLAEKGHGKEYEADMQVALDALFRAQLRFKRTGRWGLDAVGLNALRKAYDIHTAQVEVAGQGELIAASNEVNRRIRSGDIYREAA